jgi:hypothetical protein
MNKFKLIRELALNTLKAKNDNQLAIELAELDSLIIDREERLLDYYSSFDAGDEDWKLVPKEPTEKMIKAGVEKVVDLIANSFVSFEYPIRDIWEAMYVHAPKHSSEKN